MTPLWKQTATLEQDVVVTGHTHVPMAERFGDTLVINPGSVGEAPPPRERLPPLLRRLGHGQR